MDEAPLAINGWDGSLYENILKLCWNSSFPFSINSSSFYPFFSPTGVNDRHTVVILTSSSLPSTWRSSPLPPPPQKVPLLSPRVSEQVSAHAFDVIQLVAEEVPRSLAGGSRRHVTACDSGPGTDARPARRSLPTPLTHQKDTMTKDKDKCQYKDRDKENDKRVLNPFHWVRFWAQEDFRYACQPQTSIDTSRSQQKHINKVFSLFGDCGLKHSPPRLTQQQQKQTDSYFLGSVKRNDSNFHVIVVSVATPQPPTQIFCNFDKILFSKNCPY